MRPTSPQYDWDNLVRSRAERHPSGLGNAQFREPKQSSAKMAVFRSNRRQPASKSSVPSADVNHENANKKRKARTNVRASCKSDNGHTSPRDPMRTILLVLFGLLFRRRQAFQTLEQLFLGHALDSNFGVVGIDAGTRRPDQGNRIGLRLVDLDELLQ